MSTAMYFCLLPILLAISGSEGKSSERVSFYDFPGISEESYSKDGDIIIGNLALALEDSDIPAEGCSKKTRGLSYTADTTEAIAFAVDLVNNDTTVLPNVTLGFVIRGVCRNSPGAALATSLYYLPRTKTTPCNDSLSYHGRNNITNSNCDSTKWQSDDVIGIVSPDLDRLTTMISSLYAVARVPIVGATEVGDELSNKKNHPFFFRITAPSMYQIKAMLKFISTNGWSYLSVVYQEGPYGQKVHENMMQNAPNYGICIATSIKIKSSTDYNQLVKTLLKYSRARVVLLFMFGSQFRNVLREVIKNNASGHFIFIGDKNIVNYSGFKYIGAPDDPSIGVFTFDLFYTYVTPFYEYLRQQKVATSKNPWLRGAFEYIKECSYDLNQNVTKHCSTDRDIFTTYRYRTSKETAYRIDAVLTLAHAAHDLLADNCPGAKGREARHCINGELLREYLKNVSFGGYNSHIEFDENQDVKGSYVIGQFAYDYYDYPFTRQTPWKHMTRENVAVYDASTDSITYLAKPITWSHVKKYSRIVPWTINDSVPIDIPESVCSRPCVLGEYKIEKEVPCCWECLRCRDNERLINGNTGCQACPILTWPDPQTGFTTCIDIPTTYPKMGDTIPILLASSALVLLVLAVLVFIGYMVFWDQKVIKASSKELSLIQLLAIFIGYTTVLLFQTTPTDAMCGTIFFFMCMSFALLYCPLLIKTIRIYRIFQSGAKNERPRFINTGSQLALASSLIAVQVCLCVVCYVLYWPRAKRTQPIWSEKMVELSCDLTFPGLASFLGYNVVLVFLCSVFAFMVRKLPDNFNESKFISMCVSTTLLIWLAFIPTYFTTDREYIRAFLLSTALILNHTVALLLLFVSKIYAARFLPPEAGSFSASRS